MHTSTFSQRFLLALANSNHDRESFARAIRRSVSNISHWANEKVDPSRLSNAVAKKTEDALGVRWEWLVTGKGDPKTVQQKSLAIINEYDEIRAPDEIGTDTVEFVRFHPACSVSAGGGFENSEDAAGKVIGLSFRSRSLSKRNVRAADAVVINVIGDSMEPTLSDGDQVMYDETRRSIIDGKMYVVRIGGGCFVKRLYTRPSSVLLKSDNPFHEAFEARLDGDDIELLGQVVWSASWKI